MYSDMDEEADSLQASATGSSKGKGKKASNSKKKALTKAERKRLTERLRGTDTKLLWHEINCKLNKSTVSECNLDSESSKRSSESSLDSQFHRLVKQVSSASTDHTLVVHPRDTEEIIGEKSFMDVNASADSDDVLYRFCGAALASMLHSRYKLIQTCPLERNFNLLQSINSKVKSHIPDYLQYRDRGFMYFPSEQFLPFLRALDKNVRQYTNPDSFRRYGSQLVKVRKCV